jgi:hypothetical protein
MSQVEGSAREVGTALSEPLMLLTPEQVLQVDRAFWRGAVGQGQGAVAVYPEIR